MACEQEYLASRCVICEQPEQCTAPSRIAMHEGVVEKEGGPLRREQGLKVGQAHGEIELVTSACM